MKYNATPRYCGALQRIVRVAAMGLLVSFAGISVVKGQGRVFINEYLPWPNNGCAVTSEFIELMNFGPGPMNIGCYIITDGDYSITIPPNTLLQPGQYFVLAGQNVLPQGCGNINRSVNVDLNWTTCGCTSSPIPTTGDGFLTDGGSSSEQVVLLDPSGNVADAVVRVNPESSSTITTSAIGGCAPRTYDLDNMGITYETIGQSDGRGNSMARETDGGCAWLKDTQQSAGDNNNTFSSDPNLDGTVVTDNTMTCSGTATATIYIYTTPYSSIFPINYILARDANNNGIYDLSDSYSSGTATGNPNSFTLTGLGPGNYEILVDTKTGCGMTLFDFSLTCTGTVLNSNFAYFKASLAKDNTAWLFWNLADRKDVSAFDIEKSPDGSSFTKIGSINPDDAGYQYGYNFTDHNLSSSNFYRVKMTSTGGKVYYSTVQLLTLTGKNSGTFKAYPNPFRDRFTAQITTAYAGANQVMVTDMYGRTLKTMNVVLQAGENIVSVETGALPAGMYYLLLKNSSQVNNQVIKMVKTN